MINQEIGRTSSGIDPRGSVRRSTQSVVSAASVAAGPSTLNLSPLGLKEPGNTRKPWDMGCIAIQEESAGRLSEVKTNVLAEKKTMDAYNVFPRFKRSTDAFKTTRL